jgi:FAD/FMN-containing dehydrogenase
VVIPLNRMGEYTDGIERINIELSIKNKLQLVDELQASSPPAICRSARATTPAKACRDEEMLGDRRSRPTSCWRKCGALDLSAGRISTSRWPRAARAGRAGPGRCCRCSKSA